MNSPDDEQIRKLVKNAFPSMQGKGTERDLWPQIKQGLNKSEIRIPWFDWILLSTAALLCLVMPEVVPGLLYNL